VTLSRLLRIAHHRFRSLLRSRTMDEETARELAFHFEQLVREQIEEGVPAEEARHAARRILGSQPRLEEECRDERRSTWLHDLRQDLTYAWRMLRAHRGFTIVAVMSLALGIGANAAILGVIRGVLLDPLPFPDADRIVVIRTLPLDNPQQTQRAQLTDYVAWRDALVAVRDGSSAGGGSSSARAIEAIGVSLVDRRDWGAENDTTPAERLEGQLVSPSMFATLGVPPLVGRVFTDDDGARESDARVIVISHRLWQRRFDSDPRIAGRQVRLNGVSTTIIGVMPPTFRYPDGSDYWVPLRITPRLLQGSARFFGVTARLAPGATIAQADAEVAAVAARLARETPGRSAGWGVRVDSLRETMYGWTRRPLLTLQTAVGLVLVIACVNVAGLLLARGRARAAELALRASLGAGRGRIVRQLLTESLLLSGLGGMLGLIVTWWGLRLSVLIVPPPSGAWITPVEFDLRVAGLIALLSLVTGLAFGIAPAFAATRRDLVQAFSGARGGTHARGATAAAGGRAMWGTLAAAQIALAVILLIGTGLLLHSVIRFALRPLNFEPEGLLTFEYRVPAGDYIRPLAAPANGATFDIVPPPSLMIARIHERLRSIPGTNGVAGIAYTHVNSFIVPTMTLRLEREPGTPSPRLRGEGWGEGYQAAGATRAAYFLITPDLFKTMGAAIVRGRELRDTDASGAPWVAIVNETAARRFWPGLDPIGQRMTVDVVGDEQPREVVGVVRDIPVRRDREAPEPVVYVSYLQQPSRYREPWAGMFGQMYFVVRTSGDPLRLVPAVRQAVAEIDPQRPIANIARVDRQMDIGVQVRGVFTLALGVFAAVAMSLAAIGIYGTLAYAVAQRTREIGIRIALGATRREVLALIGRRAIAVIVAGLIAGLAGALALTRLIASQLWGVTPTDPVTFAGVSLLVASVALLASFAPVRRAMRVDPTIALKHE
jgi:putative ABC transport system permease protein